MQTAAERNAAAELRRRRLLLECAAESNTAAEARRRNHCRSRRRCRCGLLLLLQLSRGLEEEGLHARHRARIRLVSTLVQFDNRAETLRPSRLLSSSCWRIRRSDPRTRRSMLAKWIERLLRFSTKTLQFHANAATSSSLFAVVVSVVATLSSARQHTVARTRTGRSDGGGSRRRASSCRHHRGRRGVRRVAHAQRRERRRRTHRGGVHRLDVGFAASGDGARAFLPGSARRSRHHRQRHWRCLAASLANLASVGVLLLLAVGVAVRLHRCFAFAAMTTHRLECHWARCRDGGMLLCV